MRSEVARRTNFSAIRYGQCWEDADILIQALDVAGGRRCLSIASAGDNALSLLAAGAAKVVALDLNPAQLACLGFRVAACRNLSHPELLELVGSRPSSRRLELYNRCRKDLSGEHCAFWDAHPGEITGGIGGAGKFERYFAMFRNKIMPLIHRRSTIERLLAGGERHSRQQFYETHWNNLRWRLLFRIFFSRFVMGRMGRDPAFFRYVKGSVADRILKRTQYALTELDPFANPYLHWILTGRHGEMLPYWLRPENFATLRAGLDRLEYHLLSVEEYLSRYPQERFDAFNLSDIFEYMSSDNYHLLLEKLINAATSGARLAYWNMLAPRRRPSCMADRLDSLDELGRELLARDKAFFYMDFVVEQRR